MSHIKTFGIFILLGLLILCGSVSATTVNTPYGSLDIYITNQNNNTVAVLNATTNTQVAVINVGISPEGIDVSPNGKYVAITCPESPCIDIISTANNSVMANISSGIGYASYAAFSPDGSRLYVTYDTQSIMGVFNTTTWTLITNISMWSGNDVCGVVVSPNGTRVFVPEFNGPRLACVNATSNTWMSNTSSFGSNSGPYDVEITPDGTKLYVTLFGGHRVAAVNANTGVITGNVSGTFNYPRGVAITPDGLKAYVANEGAGTVSVINVSNDTAYKTITVGTDPRGVTISPDGAYLYVTNNGANTVSKIYIANDTVVSTISGFSAPMSLGNAMRQTRLPTANMGQNVTSGTVPFAVSFTGSTTAGTPTAFSWNFGDGGTSTTQNPTHTYTSAGTYTVIFNASNIAGYSVDTETNLITASAAGLAPVANFTANVTTGTSPKAILFTDSSTNTPTSWQWNFGDGTSNATTQNPTHTYTSAGTYTVTLTATNAAGSGVKTRTNYISITPESVTPCVSSFTASPTSGTLPLVVTFTDTSTNTPTSWQWNFGDGTSNSSSRNPVHIYNSAGTYTVMLTATNTGGGNTKTETNYIVVSPVNSIIANFSANRTSGIIPQQVQFTDASAGATSWDWNFGDGTTSTSQNPLHTYTYATTYTVTLNVSDGASSDSEIKSGYITISPSGGGDSGVLAHFTYGAVSTAAQFSDASLGSPESWEWNFGDGNTSIEQNPVHEFSTPGTYLVTLSVTKGGITSYYSYPVTVNVGAPNNYSQYYQNFFIPGMGGWDFVSHTEDFWTTVAPSALFWAIIILIPYLTIYNRTGTIIIPAVLYLFTGGVLAVVMPPFLGQFYYWFIILGSAGVIYKMFIGE